ncbi:MAG TPA: YbhB/YbcL family Raf kinase inhibitor-like protein [Kofleriaceae bacterium]|jgi:hypothetical protein
MRAQLPNLLVALLGCTIPLGACSGDGVDPGGGKVDSGVATDGSSSPSDGSLDTGSGGAFALTSPTITAGGTIPLAHVCANKGGMNLSPQLAWTNPPSGTQSFAVIFFDKDNGSNGMFFHCSIYDIAGTATGLPADVDKQYAPADVPGAHTTPSFSNSRGWNGPCPPATHEYEFELFALGTATAPNTSMATTNEDLYTAINGVALGTATLTASFTP